MFTYEDKIAEIDKAISQHSHRWTLKARLDIDFQDVSQLLRIHIHNKFDQWEQDRPIEPWVHRLIRNQLINILRNVYSGMSRPCLRCPSNMGEDLCTLYRRQCNDCPLFAKWEKTKKRKSDVHLPVSLENHTEVISQIPNVDIDFDKAVPLLNKRLKAVLRGSEWQFYDLMYIQNKSEAEVIKIMDFKNTEKEKVNRFKRMLQIKKNVMDKAKEILMEHGLEN